jgi:hypothetical protein
MNAERGLHITIGALDPRAVLGEGKVTLSREIQMVKAGLLYGDSARLCSMAASLVLSFQRFGESAVSATKLEQWNVLLDLVGDRIDPRARDLLLKYQELRRKRHKNSQEYLLLAKLERDLGKWTGMLHDILSQQASFAGFAELKRAQDAGLLTIDTVEYLELRNLREADGKTAEMLLKRVTDAVEGTGSYPLFDDPMGMIVQAGVLFGELKPSEGAVRRGKQIGSAASLLQDLPHFDSATMDEILDIRRELEHPLVRFRSAIIRLTEGISSVPWDSDFPNDVDQLFHREIHPLIVDIEAAIRANSYMRALTSRVASDPKRFFSPMGFAVPAGLSIVATGHAGLFQLLAAIVGLAPAGVNALDIRSEIARKREEIERNQMFFYYDTKRRLSPHT